MKLARMILAVACLLGYTAALQAQLACNANLPATTSATEFTDNSDGTMTHDRTGLMWKVCAEGQTWSPDTCDYSATTSSWASALLAARNATTGNHTDWRLPNIKELESIVESKCYGPAINTLYFPSTSASAFWSASADAANLSHAWIVDFYDGTTFSSLKGSPYQVRLVRAGQTFDSFDSSRDTLPLTVSTNGASNGSVSGGPINCGSVCSGNVGKSFGVTLTASPSANFHNWGGACSGTAPSCTFTMDAAKNVIANFVPAPNVTLSPTSLDFGAQNLGTLTTLPVTLSNIGSALLHLTNIAATGDYGVTHDCGPGLSPGSSCTLTVTFSPLVIGTRNGIITITDDAYKSQQYIYLIGVGHGPIATPGAALSFGPQRAAQTVSLTNTGDAPLNSISIAASAEFSVTHYCGSSLGAGSSCDLLVTFTPSGTGTRTGSITITDSAYNSPQHISLIGTTNTWSTAASLTTARSEHTATLLPNGTVLVAGGTNSLNPALDSVEIYDPVINTWSAAASINYPRSGHTATLLPNGGVLLFGGTNSLNQYLADCMVYVPANNSLNHYNAASFIARSGHTATLLPTGHVMVAGGMYSPNQYLPSAAVYYPDANIWVTGGTSSSTSRSGHSATLLHTGYVLIAGGSNSLNPYLSIIELYVREGLFITLGWLPTARSGHTATLLPNGTVLFAGGSNSLDPYLTSAELYDPATNTWSTAASLPTARSGHTATLLPNGTVLFAGGSNSVDPYLSSVEIYDPAPGAPTGVTAQAGTGQATINFTAPARIGGGAITTYTATSNLGGFTGSCNGPAACTITVTGLAKSTAYTFAVTASNVAGYISVASAASNSVVPRPGQSIGTISFNPTTLSVGGSTTASATATSSLPVSFNSSITPTICSVSGTLATGLLPGTCTITGTQAGDATYYLPANSVTANITVTGPAVQLNPTSLTFADQHVGSTSAPQNVTLTNTGNVLLTGITPTAAVINGTVGEYALVTGTCASTLAAGASCQLAVTFTPAQAITRLGTLSVASNTAGSPNLVTLTGYGVSSNVPICTLTAAPASIHRKGSSSLTASCSPTANNYAWTGGTCVGTSASTCSVTPAATTSYTVTGTNGSGTSNPASATVTIKAADLTPIMMLLLD